MTDYKGSPADQIAASLTAGGLACSPTASGCSTVAIGIDGSSLVLTAIGPGGGGGGGGAVATYNTPGDDRVITSVNGTTIQGEANFTYDNTNTLRVTGSTRLSSSFVGEPVLTITGSGPYLAGDAVVRIDEFKDASLVVGNNYLGNNGTGLASFGHVASWTPAGSNNYSVATNALGDTFLSAKITRTLKMGINGASTGPIVVESDHAVSVGSSYAAGPGNQFQFDVSGSTRLGGGAPGFVEHQITGTVRMSGTFEAEPTLEVTGTGPFPAGGADPTYFVIKADEDRNSTAIIGQAYMGYGGFDNRAVFGHKDSQAVPTSFAFMQKGLDGAASERGSVSINAPITGYLSFAIASAHKARFAQMGTGPSAVPVPQIADPIAPGSGSRSGFGIGTNYFPTYPLDVSGGIRIGTFSDIMQTNTNQGYIGGINSDWSTGGGVPGTSSVPSIHYITGTILHTGSYVLRGSQTGFGDFGFDEGRMVISGTMALTSSAAAGFNDGTLMLVEGGNQSTSQGKPVMKIQASGGMGLVGLSKMNPKVELDIAWDSANDPNNLGNNAGGGESVTFGNQTVTAPGALYFLSSSGQWHSASAHATGSGNESLLAIALGTTVQGGPGAPGGMLIRGWANVTDWYVDDFIRGGAVYIHSGTAGNEGKMSGSAPSNSDNYSRIVGYAANNSTLIYFNPGTSWIELTESA